MYALFATPDVRARTIVYDASRASERVLVRAIGQLDWLARFELQPRSGVSRSGGLVVIGRDGVRAGGLRAFAGVARCIPLLFPLWIPLAVVASFAPSGEGKDAPPRRPRSPPGGGFAVSEAGGPASSVLLLPWAYGGPLLFRPPHSLAHAMCLARATPQSTVAKATSGSCGGPSWHRRLLNLSAIARRSGRFLFCLWRAMHPMMRLAIALSLTACSGPGTSNVDAKASGALAEPAPDCPLPTPDGGELCSCPGTSICPFGQDTWLKCSDSGTWETTDLSCVLGLHCRTSADCMSGQACCGDPYTGSWGTQITSSSCQPAPCSSDTVQLCQSSVECVQPGFVCGAQDEAYGGGSVLSCQWS